MDESGAGVPGAKLSAISPMLPRALETESDSAGRYGYSRMPIGINTITVSKQGFGTLRQYKMEVTLGAQVTWNPTLKVSSVAETVEAVEGA